MYFTFACPKCDKKLKVREELAGRNCRCPYCKSSIAIPSPQRETDQDPAEGETFNGIGELKTSVAGTRKRTRKRTGKTRGGQAAATAGTAAKVDRTDVSMIASCLLGTVLAAVFLVALIPIRHFYFGELFLQRGWVPFALVFLMSWAIAILIFKWRKLQRQKAAMLFDLLPTELAEDISVDSVDKFVRHIHNLPAEAAESFLLNRVVRALEHFRVRKNTPEVASFLASQSEIDAGAAESSYTLLNVFIWAIPILGFIGTVIGIGAAVGGFSESLESAAEISQLKTSLNSVTGGLATAFDTTLIALVMSILVMFPSSSMQKAEDDLLNWVDEYCNENLLKRLNDHREGGAERGLGGNRLAIQKTLDDALAPHHAELEGWRQKLELIGSKLTADVARGWDSINTKMQQQQGQNAEQLQNADQMAAQFQETLARLAEQTQTVQTEVAATMDQSARSIASYCTALQQGLAGLNAVLEKLGEQQVMVQAPPPRRGWFSFFR